MTRSPGADALIPADRLHRRAEGPPTAVRAAAGPVDVRRLWKRLRETVDGEVRFNAGSRGLYAQDASNYYHLPIGVVLPRHVADVAATVAACREVGAPIVARTGGTGLAGQTCNEAVVLDFSKYMRRIVELDPSRRIARVEPGVICDELTAAAEPHALTWGPKPATHSRCGFGGMLSNNCGGMNAQYAGIAVHNVEALDILLYDGTPMHLGWMTDEDDPRRHRGRRARGPGGPARLSICATATPRASANGYPGSRVACPATTSTSSCPGRTALQRRPRAGRNRGYMRHPHSKRPFASSICGQSAVARGARLRGRVSGRGRRPRGARRGAGCDGHRGDRRAPLRPHGEEERASREVPEPPAGGSCGWLLVQIGADDQQECRSPAEGA